MTSGDYVRIKTPDWIRADRELQLRRVDFHLEGAEIVAVPAGGAWADEIQMAQRRFQTR